MESYNIELGRDRAIIKSFGRSLASMLRVLLIGVLRDESFIRGYCHPVVQ